jgi:DNA-binding helix-hairpin-helix protein with protein kinase domain
MPLPAEWPTRVARVAESLRSCFVMSQHHPSRRWRGCAMCKPHKGRGVGRAAKEPVAVLRHLGKRRRISRRDLGEANGRWRR